MTKGTPAKSKGAGIRIARGIDRYIYIYIYIHGPPPARWSWKGVETAKMLC